MILKDLRRITFIIVAGISTFKQTDGHGSVLYIILLQIELQFKTILLDIHDLYVFLVNRLNISGFFWSA